MSPLLRTTRSFGLLKRAPMLSASEAELRLRIGQRRVHARDPAVAVLREHQAALAIEGQPVRADLAAARLRAGVTRRRQVQPRALALLPAMNLVGRNVREQQVAAVLDPHRPLGPVVAARQHLDRGVGCDQLVECGIQTLDARRFRELVLRTHRFSGRPAAEGDGRQRGGGERNNGETESPHGVPSRDVTDKTVLTISVRGVRPWSDPCLTRSDPAAP